MEKDVDRQELEKKQNQCQPPSISPMKPVTRDAYGGGMYANEPGEQKKPGNPPASETQNADGPAGPNTNPEHQPPPPSGDRDIDITGQSYIQ